MKSGFCNASKSGHFSHCEAGGEKENSKLQGVVRQGGNDAVVPESRKGSAQGLELSDGQRFQ